MAIVVFDDDGEDVELDDGETAALWGFTNGLEAATISACSECRSRVVTGVALTDVLNGGPAFARAVDLIALADDAPTLHLYVVDSVRCRHRGWRDPGSQEWRDACADVRPAPRATG